MTHLTLPFLAAEFTDRYPPATIADSDASDASNSYGYAGKTKGQGEFKKKTQDTNVDNPMSHRCPSEAENSSG